MLGWNHYFGKKSMTKLNIFQVNGISQLGRPNQENEEDDEDLQLAKDDVQGGQPELAIPNQNKLLTQIWTRMQDIQESIRNVNTRFDRVDQRMERIEDTLNDIQRHQAIDCLIIMLFSFLFLFLFFHVEHCYCYCYFSP